MVFFHAFFAFPAHRRNILLIPAADRWLRFYQRFWTEQLDRLDALLQAEDRPTSNPSPRKRPKP